jgi:hypothetical protein
MHPTHYLTREQANEPLRDRCIGELKRPRQVRLRRREPSERRGRASMSRQPQITGNKPRTVPLHGARKAFVLALSDCWLIPTPRRASYGSRHKQHQGQSSRGLGRDGT